MADRYEREFMHGGDARYREKHVTRWLVAALGIPGSLMLALAIFALVTAGVLPALGPMIGAVSMLVAALYFAVMRVNVTPASVEIRYGNLGPSIPVAAIASTEVVTLDAISRLAFGIKWEGPGAWRYIPPGVTHAVRVAWSDGVKKKTALIGAKDAVALARAIEEARGTGVRVDVGAATEEEEIESASAGSRRARRAR
jgi:hypothetical protein